MAGKKSFNWVAILPYLSFVVFIAMTYAGDQNVLTSLITLFFLAAAIMTSVYYAEDIAHKIGEGLGTLLLALSVTVIEVGLIVSLMTAGGSDSGMIARDTVFSAVMIVCNGIVGICLLLGGLKYKEVGFQFRGANSLLVVLFCLSIFCFVLPNYTTSVSGPLYSSSQLIFVSIISLLLYLSLVIAQTKTHTYYFQSEDQNESETSKVPPAPLKEDTSWNYRDLLVSVLALVIGLVSVIGLAKLIAPMIATGVENIGAPKAIVGLLIATIVLLPEAITAVLAARENRIQTSLNLALGSGAASIALTIPVVSIYSIVKEQELILGLDAKGTVFLLLTFMVGAMTLGNGKATALHGIVHLIILCSYFAVTLLP